MATYSNERIEKAVRDADDAFWGVIAEKFPEIKTGDLSPDAVFTLRLAQEKAVKRWLTSNTEDEEVEFK